ncbi:MAG: DUF5131 family protein [Flavobacterium sp.]|uniref:DUF5131 family protein n=1 Tax=Flavobacterium sp. TaxID=239 RepID=UPI0032673288
MEQTKIQWTDSTINFWRGCKKVSPGCKYCYMYRDQTRYGRNPEEVVRTKNNSFNQALKWKEPRKIFTNSWSDFFISESDMWRDDAWDIIRRTPQHTWQILTKRPDRIRQSLPADWGDGWDNVWLGVSVESQDYFYRASILSQIPARTRFISAEPLLGELNLLKEVDGKKIIDDIHWVIIGGESGNETGKWLYRPCELKWLEKIIVDLKSETDVAVFNKQLGTWLSKQLGCKERHGGNIEEWPEHLRVREFPKHKI